MTTEQLNTIVGISSIIIGLSALGLTIYQAYLSRMHFKKSIQPLLSLQCNLNEVKKEISFLITNNGHGSALINQYELMIGEREIKNRNDLNLAIIELLLLDKVDIKKTEIRKEAMLFKFDEPISISSGSQLTIFKLSFEGESSINNLMQKIKELCYLNVEYEDLFKRKKSIKYLISTQYA